MAGTAKACNVSQTLGGIPPASFGGTAYSMYNQTCLKDTSTGEYCSDFLAGFMTDQDTDGSSLSRDIICSNCVTNLFLGLQGSEYSSYDATFADQWTAIQQQCGTNYNTTVPDSPFPSLPAVVPNTTMACPSSQQYTVQSGDNCNAIAQSKSIATRQIISINRLATDCSNLIAGQNICLPPSTCTTYTVQSGDTCTSIVSGEGMDSTSQLLGINPGLYCQSLLSSEIICVSPPGGQYTGTTIAGATATQTAVFATATVAPPGVIPYGTTLGCGKWYTVKQYDTCQLLLVAAQISLDLFLAINPSVNANCTNLDIGFSYCMLPTSDWSTAGSNGTQTTSAPPAPTPPGTTNSCYTWHTIVSGDTCANLEIEYGITFQQMQQWNPNLSDDCSNLLLDEAYCMSGPTGTTTTSAAGHTTVPPPTATPSGTTNACYEWHIVVSGDSCWAIEQEYAITMDQLQTWNPQLASDCSNLLLGDAYCVDGPDGTSSSKKKRRVTKPKMPLPHLVKEESRRGGYPIGWPYPIRR